MLQVKTPALVLDKEPQYNDEGKILVFTERFGLLYLTASGIYRSGASLAAWTEPPVRIVADVSLPEKMLGHGRLLTLSSKNYFTHIRSSYSNMSWFFFYAFLLKNFLPLGIKSPKIFNLLKETLGFQDSWTTASKRDLNFAYFLVKLLKAEGICSGFSSCVVCEEGFSDSDTAYFSLNEQGLLCADCSRKIVRAKARADQESFGQGSTSLKFLRLLPQGENLNLPSGLLRVGPEERAVLTTCENSEQVEQAYANIFSRPKIDERLFTRVRNFLLIFLAPLL